VLDTLAYLKHETNVWFEITTLLIPTKNDSDAENRAMAKWIFRELGPDVPLHFTAFHPDFKLTELPPHARGDAQAACAASRSTRACTTSTPATCTIPKGGPPTVRSAVRR
jgi:pyruvate-formate lyase-activating enzyme